MNSPPPEVPANSTSAPRRARIPWPVRGVVAGLSGTGAMALWYHGERMLRRGDVTGAATLADGTSVAGLWSRVALDFDDSVVPGRIVASLLHLPPVSERQAAAITLALRWSYGSAFGIAHVLLRRRLPEPAATAIFGTALMTMTFTAFPALGHTPPPWRWSPDVMVSAVGSHAAYVITAAAVDDALLRAGQR